MVSNNVGRLTLCYACLNGVHLNTIKAFLLLCHQGTLLFASGVAQRPYARLLAHALQQREEDEEVDHGVEFVLGGENQQNRKDVIGLFIYCHGRAEWYKSGPRCKENCPSLLSLHFIE